MDILRTSLQILFGEIRIESLLETKCGGSPSSFDREQFLELYRRMSPYSTAEQCEAIADMVSSFYLTPDREDSSLAYCPHRSIFNALLRFSGAVLLEDTETPVCDFRHLLRWQSLTEQLGEDLLTTSYLAAKDEKEVRSRWDFAWGMVIGQNDPSLNAVFDREMADVHMHLKGSSSNFDLNWLSLMNYPKARERQFDKIKRLQKSQERLDSSDTSNLSFYNLVLKAAAIRFYLFSRYVKKRSCDPCENLARNFREAGDHTVLLSDELDTMICAEHLYVNPSGTQFTHDYIWPVDSDAVKYNPNVVVSGERRLLYQCFRECYSGRLSERDSHWLYLYLLIKNCIRNELVQSNGFVGFGNFDSYEKRKTLFIDGYPVYEQLIEPLALGQYFNHADNRYVESRITPKSSARELELAVEKTDNRLLELTKADKSKVYYVLHFIKEKEDCHIGAELLNPRNFGLREKVRKQSLAINEFRRVSLLHRRVVGIDAANSEMTAGPEVFAQAFRYLRDCIPERYDGQKVCSLGMTYHVGEDFLSPVTGLRAIDEALHFLHIGRKSRLGHALVLGIDGESYLHKRHNTLLLPKLQALDDIVWCLHEIRCESSFVATANWCEDLFRKLFREIYGDVAGVAASDYYDSWLLRGDNPSRYIYSGCQGVKLPIADNTPADCWSHYDLNDDSDALAARHNNIARELYNRYHYDSVVRRKGSEIMEIRRDGVCEVIKFLQLRMLAKLAEENVGIETNPTSNRKIGGFEFYNELPIFKFFPVNDGVCSLSVSVNTDDKGIFVTSLEREYALLAAALYKKSYSDGSYSKLGMQGICDWLDRIRRNTLTQKFINYV